MNKDETIEEGRAKDGKFKPGHKLQKRKKPISVEELETALTDEASKQKLTLVRHAIKRAYVSDIILKVILDKFVPNISVATSDIKPIQIIIERYYQSKDQKLTDSIDMVKDEETGTFIAKES